MKNKRRGILRIGTSNIVVPGTKQSFPEEFKLKSRLNFYSSLFNTLEINSSFYKVPLRSTFEKWALDVPEDFRFTVKLWKEITHVKELCCDLQNIDFFLNKAEGLGYKRGCLLVQFPGKISLEYYSRVEQILQRIRENSSGKEWPLAVEFRNAAWYVRETFELMDEYEASIVLHDIPKARNMELNRQAPFVYLRFHGPKGDYRGSYANEFLKEQSEKIQSWLVEGKDVYAYFNNTMGAALDNVLTLKKLAER
jgi:uncharacterized protein YecE (DUF72 family)